MRVTVLFFARARELVGTSEAQLELEDTASTDSIAERLLHDYPPLQEIMGRCQMASVSALRIKLHPATVTGCRDPSRRLARSCSHD